VLKIGDLEIDRVAHAVQRGGQSIELSPKEFALLEFLILHEDQAVTRTAIVEQVWKLNFDTMTNVVDVYSNYLRRKIDMGYERPLIRTIPGLAIKSGGTASATKLPPQACPAYVAPGLGPRKGIPPCCKCRPCNSAMSQDTDNTAFTAILCAESNLGC
jgi:hypothetical protein